MNSETYKMNTGDLVKKVHQDTGLTWRQSETAVRSAIRAIRDNIANGGEVHLKGLLQVDRQNRKARTYTAMGSQKVEKPAHVRPKISLSAPLVKEATVEV